jgi:predicted acylesterase/phospholipase RssA
VTSTPESNLSNCRFIRTYRAPTAEYNCTILEAIQATTALPGWFPPIEVGPAQSKETLAGGAIRFNNPTKQALDEARQRFNSDQKASVILGLGSGLRHPRSLKNGMKDGLRQALDDRAQSGEETAEELSRKFENSTFYHRFSVNSGLENLSITGWMKDDIGTITAHTKAYLEKVSSSLSAVAELLVKNEGSVTLGQLSGS